MKKVLLCNVYVTTVTDPNHTIPAGSIVDVVKLGRPESDSLVSHPDCGGFHVWNRDLADVIGKDEIYTLNKEEQELFSSDWFFRGTMIQMFRDGFSKEQALLAMVISLIKERNQEQAGRASMYESEHTSKIAKMMGAPSNLTGDNQEPTATQVAMQEQLRRIIINGLKGEKKDDGTAAEDYQSIEGN